MRRLGILLLLTAGCSRGPIDEKRVNADLRQLWSISAEMQMMRDQHPRDAFREVHTEDLRDDVKEIREELDRGVDEPALEPALASARALADHVREQLR
jgi:hypothetical protein